MLLLGRKEGEGAYVGRFARVTVSEVLDAKACITIEHDKGAAVSEYR